MPGWGAAGKGVPGQAAGEPASLVATAAKVQNLSSLQTEV